MILNLEKFTEVINGKIMEYNQLMQKTFEELNPDAEVKQLSFDAQKAIAMRIPDKDLPEDIKRELMEYDEFAQKRTLDVVEGRIKLPDLSKEELKKTLFLELEDFYNMMITYEEMIEITKSLMNNGKEE